jgi:EAL domain-containing protein (putative c-di-GMP-specific phosphodiesterase class I)
LHSAGIKLALDDFGTSNSNFIALLDDSFDILKIDKTFVDYLDSFSDEDEHSRETILETMVTLCKKLGLRSIVEGVESSKQLEYTKDLGCDIVQGYIISKPIPLDNYKFNQYHQLSWWFALRL